MFEQGLSYKTPNLTSILLGASDTERVCHPQICIALLLLLCSAAGCAAGGGAAPGLCRDPAPENQDFYENSKASWPLVQEIGVHPAWYRLMLS